MLRQWFARLQDRQAPALEDAYKQLRQGGHAGALAAFLRVLEANPENAAAWNGAGLCRREMGDADAAIDCFRAAARFDPALAEPLLNLGNFAYLRGDHDAAIAHFVAYLSLEPGNQATQNILGSLYAGQGRFAESRACHRAVLDVDPHFLQLYSVFLLMLNFDPEISPEGLYAEHRTWGELCAVPLSTPCPASDIDPDPERRLRIGYVSPYFVRQPVAYFAEPLLTAHGKQGFEVFLYSDADAKRSDDVTERLRAAADHWRDTRSLDDIQFCAQVRSDRIDILVDLTGHNGQNRLLAFARRAAPLQVTYLGPNTTGMSAMDYRMTDSRVDPPGAEACSSERLLRLPGAQWAYRPPAEAPEVGPLPALERGYVTFGSFNHAAKLSEPLLAVWADLLARLPGSRLTVTGISSESHRARLMLPFAARGIAPDRIRFAPHPGYDRYWDLYRDVDIALDSYPFNGVTTTMGCLWMGLPVVSLGGSWIASRYGASLLQTLGEPGWAVTNPRAYIDAAASLASDTARLAEIRRGLRARLRNSRLLDGPALARDVEKAYRGIWRTWCGRGAHENM